MKINETSMDRIVPNFMQGDKTVKGFCAAADILIKKMNEKAKLVNLFGNLDMVSNEDLDFIAKQEKIPWYDTAYTRAQKERIIKNYEKNCMILGTKEAVKNITTEIFGENKIFEWFEYDGEQKHYKVETEFVGDIEKAASDYEKRIRQVKSFRSVLDNLTFWQGIRLKNAAGAVVCTREDVVIKEKKE